MPSIKPSAVRRAGAACSKRLALRASRLEHHPGPAAASGAALCSCGRLSLSNELARQDSTQHVAIPSLRPESAWSDARLDAFLLARVSRALDVADGAQEVGGLNAHGDLGRTEMLLQSCRVAPICCSPPPPPPPSPKPSLVFSAIRQGCVCGEWTAVQQGRHLMRAPGGKARHGARDCTSGTRLRVARVTCVPCQICALPSRLARSGRLLLPPLP